MSTTWPLLLRTTVRITESTPESSPVPIQRPQNKYDVRSYSAARPSRSSSPHQSLRQSQSKDPRINMMFAPTPRPALRSTELADPLAPRRVEATLA